MHRRLLFNAIAMVAAFEADRTRTHEGMVAAKAKGRVRGEKPKPTTAHEKNLVELYWAGRHTTG